MRVAHACDAEQTELVTPVEAALDRYVRLQEEMELERPADEDGAQGAQHHQQQAQSQQPVAVSLASAAMKPSHGVVEKSSSIDAEYKFRVQKIASRPSGK